MDKLKMSLGIRITVLVLTIIIFLQFSMFYYVQTENYDVRNDVYSLEENINNLSSGVDKFAVQSDKLFETILDMFQNYESKFNVYNELFSESNNNILNMENSIVDINKNIDNLIENYNRLEYLYNQINTQAKTDNIENNEDMNDIYYGRLYIPSANIDVALYYGWQQYITDRVDSANIFSWKEYDSCTIADHSNQEFSKLFDVQIGTTGYIELKSGKIINIECVDIFNGHNNGHYIINEYGVNMANKGDYVMYTCIDHWTNVRICLWEIV